MASPSDAFANAQELTLEGSTLTSGRDMSVSQTTNYNITIVAGATSSNADRLRVEEDWKKLFVQIVEKAKRKHENPDEEESDQALVNPKSTTKRFVMYTAVDIAKKKLKSTVTIALTLTPAGPTPSGQPWPAIVWKTLVFQPGARRQDIMWYSEMGFITVKEKAGGVLSPHGLEAVVEPKHIAIFPDSEEPIFSAQEELPIETTSVAILNKSPQSQRFALCVVDRTRVETDQFLPVIDLGSLSPDGILVCDPPVMLQAYVISPNAGYEERKPLKEEDMKRPLFPQPVNVTQLKPTTPFRLYSNNTGKVILEKE